MKKVFEKNGLFKVIGLIVLLTVLLSWVLPITYYNGSEMVTESITRIGLMDFFTYGLLGIYYFTVLITFLFVLGGFYELLNRTKGYQIILDKVSKAFKGKEKIFVLITMFVLAALTAICNEFFPLLIFVPFVISIVLKLKLDKITALCASFGGILIGTIGSIYSSKIVGMVNTSLQTDFKTQIIAKLALFVITFVFFYIFTLIHMNKKAKDKKENAEEIIDKFEIVKQTGSKKKAWPLVIVLAIVSILAIIAYVPWTTAFKLEWVTKVNDWATSSTILGVTIINYVLGKITALGSWDIFGIQVIMLFASLIISWIYKVKFDDLLDSYGKGFVKMGKTVIIALMVLLVLEFTVMYPVVPTIVQWIMELTKSFNVYLGTVAVFIASIFGVEMQYVMQMLGTYFSSTFADSTNILVVLLQAVYGLVQFVAPTSMALVIGLSYLDIPIQKWWQFIWKFFVGMFIIILILLTIIAYV